MVNRPKREGIMLCQPAEPRKIARLGEKFFAQPKLNGERFRVEWFRGEPVLLSSYGNAFQFLDRIKQAFIQLAGITGELPFDGEIYKHGWPRERIDSALRRTKNYNPDVEELEAHIFDLQVPLAQWRRLQALQEMASTIKSGGDTHGVLEVVPFKIIESLDWIRQTAEYIQEGYEGSIFRAPQAEYSMKRPWWMLKYKPTEKDEYTIVGFQEGKGWAEGMLGAFVVQGDDGVQFNVGSGRLLTKPLRAYLWNIRAQILGKQLIVKHEATDTSGGIPLCSVALEIKGLIT